LQHETMNVSHDGHDILAVSQLSMLALYFFYIFLQT
jgi:hypothetical protein